MGCDIHWILEKWSPRRKEWIGVYSTCETPLPHGSYVTKDNWDDSKEICGATGFFAITARQRNYEVFAKLAGVRGPGPDPRGIPDDASDLTKLALDSWGRDGHSHSWDWAWQFALAYMGDEDRQQYIKRRMTGAEIDLGHILGLRQLSSDDRAYRVVYFFDS